MTRPLWKPSRLYLTSPERPLAKELRHHIEAASYSFSDRIERAQIFLYAGPANNIAALIDWADKTQGSKQGRWAFISGSTLRLQGMLHTYRGIRLINIGSHSPQSFITRILSELFYHDKPKPLAPGLIGYSRAVHQLVTDIQNCASNQLPVLILGESGCGKERTAQMLHQGRGIGELYSINCATLKPNLVESELFGAAKGAFTGAESQRDGILAACGEGTCFLDEIGELPLQAQAALLRLLENGEIRSLGTNRSKLFKGRLVFATNRDLQAQVQKGHFREDLYHRLQHLVIRIPPLRQRREDLQLLVQHFLDQLNQKHGKAIAFPEIAPLFQYHWPGNIRELASTINNAYIQKTQPGHQLNLQIDLKTVPIQEESTQASNENDPIQIPYYKKEDSWTHLKDRAMHTMLTTLLRDEGSVTPLVTQQSGLSRAQIYRELKGLNLNTKGESVG